MNYRTQKYDYKRSPMMTVQKGWLKTIADRETKEIVYKKHYVFIYVVR